MTGVRNIVDRGGPNPDKMYPGDLLLGAENVLAGAIATVGTGLLSGAAIATGIIRRTGSTANYADAFDSAANIIAAIRGNNNVDAEVVPGSTFRLMVQNTVAFSDTVTASADGSTILGTGTTAIAASTWREYLLTILNSSAMSIQQMNVDGSTAVLTYVLPPNRSSHDMSAQSLSPSAGALAVGTGIPAGAYVLNVNLGQGGALGVTLSANTTSASGVGGTAVTFLPRVQVDGLRSGTL